LSLSDPDSSDVIENFLSSTILLFVS
jgi:hypothetical protein